MSGVVHLSMRVPWRDRLWDQYVCDDPLNNSSCTLLQNIGPKRDDDYELEHASAGIDTLDADRLPCLSERATFLSPVGYSVRKTHPYSWNRALKGKIHPTDVTVPGYAFEAVPFRWLNRKLLDAEVGTSRVPGYVPAAEDRVDDAIGFESASWVMDGDNQQAIMRAFFEPVSPRDSLVFVYLKHSPLQEQRTDRLLVGAARVTAVTLPPPWNQTDGAPFTSSMWETVVEHSLRPDMADGILLPYQQLVSLLDAGTDISGALAWAPEGRDVEFSYVTEHLSDDAALEALSSLQAASAGMRELGIPLPDAADMWVSEQIERLWQVRGPVPGLAAVLETMGVEMPGRAVRAILEHTADLDPWPFLRSVLDEQAPLPHNLQPCFPRPVRRSWQKLDHPIRALLLLLSAFDISADQVNMLSGDESGFVPGELLKNPYLAVTCTYGWPEHIPFSSVDRALFPPAHVSWAAPLPDELRLDGGHDPRRIEALLTEVLEQRARAGDTVVPGSEVLNDANVVELATPVSLNRRLLAGLDLDHDSLLSAESWRPLTSVALAGDDHAYKLTRLREVADAIREWVDTQRARPRFGPLADARVALDAALARDDDVQTTATTADGLEERARQEKAAGLSTLYDAPLSVLIGPAGTGKTTLLKALVDLPGVADGGVLLLAPTGKARVQLQTKVGRPARTLAGHLMRSDRYDGEAGLYVLQGAEAPRQSYGLVVIDEASMLTEEMLAATLDAFTSVQRLVLVGDPRQLPPIGAGRPFVDLVSALAPETSANGVRVGPGYVELQVPRRQLPDGSHGVRHDLELARCFGAGGRGAADDDIWHVLNQQPDLPTVRYHSWKGGNPLAVLHKIMREELRLDSEDDLERAFATTYDGVVSGDYLNWELESVRGVDRWQILSPTRSRTYGTVEVNRHLKQNFRARETRFGQVTRKWNIPRPLGPELIVRGDKVMQTVNESWRKSYPAGGLDYIANGEIGVGVGRLSQRAKRSLFLNVGFSSQPGYTYGYRPGNGDEVPLELAWAVTVHKSQGSEFGITFLLLPARSAVSRELLYTALTRQKDRVVILHEGTLDDLRELAQPWRSDTARRLTDLFTTPDPVAVSLPQETQPRRFDRRLLHVAPNGTPVASKNEVIIAGILDSVAKGRWEYERPFTGSDGRTVLPDFTIAAPDGRTILWEHAGMLNDPDYARKWEKKQAWFVENGVRPESEGGGPRGVLVWTDDRDGADAQAWRELAESLLGEATAPLVGGPPHPGPRRPRPPSSRRR